jgi:hypothetical protein
VNQQVPPWGRAGLAGQEIPEDNAVPVQELAGDALNKLGRACLQPVDAE